MHSWVELTIIVSTIDPSLANMEHRYLLIIPGFVLISDAVFLTIKYGRRSK